MTFRSHLIAAACSALLAIAMPQVSKADELTAGQKSEVERILRDYLIAHPEIIQDAMSELDKRQSAADAEKHRSLRRRQRLSRRSRRFLRKSKRRQRPCWEVNHRCWPLETWQRTENSSFLRPMSCPKLLPTVCRERS